MHAGKQIRLLRLAERHVNGFVAEAIEVLDGSAAVAEDVSPRPQDQAGRPQLEAATEPVAYSTKVSNLGSRRSRRWKLEGPLPLGTFDEHSREAEESWKWGDEFVERYGPFIRFSGRDGFAPAMLALGFDLTHVSPNGEVVGFHLGSGGGSKRAITQFFRSDDFAETNELLSMIRGGGPRGRSGFRAHDPLPEAYHGFKTEILGDRIAGKWNVQAVVVDADDHQTMLRHTFLQSVLRGLV